jgi:hypothetical protein
MSDNRDHAATEMGISDVPPQPAAPVDPLIGKTLDGRYRIEKVLGEGGMGLVYKAMHTTLAKPLAIKVLKAEVSKNEEIVQRFRQEAQSASAIGNQHIIDISDFGTLPDGSTYFVMEFLAGSSLTDALETTRFTTERTIHVTKQLCNALGAAHEIGVIHRDMKPDNVQLIVRGQNKDFVKVLDFGIAKVGGTNSKLTRAGQVFGTPHYMSPEQCAGTSVDGRTDIYAVGVMMYEMATGKVPFDADNLMGILTKHLYENPIPPRQLPPPTDVPPALEAIIMKSLAKKCDARYQSMAELHADLEALEQGRTPQAVVDAVDRKTSGSSGNTMTDTPGRVSMSTAQPAIPLKKSKAPLFIGVAAAVVLIGGGVAMLGSGGEAEHVVAPAPAAAKPEPAPVAPEPAAPEPAPAAVAQPAAPAAPTAVEIAKVTIESDPPGAEVYRANALLGNTPFVIAKPTDSSQFELEVRSSGYKAKAVAITQFTGDKLNVALRKESGRPANRPAASASSAPAPRPSSAPTKPAPSNRTEVLDPWD